mmetsp:Transcript_9776/g.17656  ORF Transcript_9776/g.17656 Transcript_9776/m.17656 type:complete len:174 (+) Transcript_9776:130-651(+)
MNGLSFEEFENASFDSLYNRGFAGARSFDEASKGWQAQAARALQDEAAQQRSLNYGGTRQLPSGSMPRASGHHVQNALPASTSFPRAGVPQKAPAARALPSATPMPMETLSAVPMNDMGILPGSTRVDHTWRPSKEADSRAGHLALTGTAPTVTQTRPIAGGEKGTFIGWKSN